MQKTAAAVIAVIACLVLGAVLLRGCGGDPIPSDGWVQDLRVMNRDFEPLGAEVSTRVGRPVDVVVWFVPGTPRPEAFPDRKLLKNDQWRVRAEILDESGTRIFDWPPGGFYDEMVEFDQLGIEYFPEREHEVGGGGERVWISPDPPREMRPEARYLWGRMLVPSEPGTYSLVLRLYPAADPPRSRHLNPEFGRPVTVFESTLKVSPGEPRSPRLRARAFKLNEAPRTVHLRRYPVSKS